MLTTEVRWMLRPQTIDFTNIETQFVVYSQPTEDSFRNLGFDIHWATDLANKGRKNIVYVFKATVINTIIIAGNNIVSWIFYRFFSGLTVSWADKFLQSNISRSANIPCSFSEFVRYLSKRSFVVVQAKKS
jgi:hypothetical protein